MASGSTTMNDDAGATETSRRLVAFESLLDRVFERFARVAPGAIDSEMHAALADVGDFVGADRAYVVRYDHATDLTWMTHEWCATGVEPSIDAEQGRSFTEAPRQHDRLIALQVNEIRDVTELPDSWAEDRAYLVAQGITAICELPLVRDGMLIGVVGFDSTSGAVPWTREDVTLLRALAASFVQMIERSRSDAALADSHDDLRRTVAALERSESRFASLVDNLPDAVVRFDRDGNVLFANRTAMEYRDRFVAAGGDVVGNLASVENENVTRIRHAVTVAFDDGATTRLEVAFDLEGEERWADCTVVPERVGDDPAASVILVARDITERHRYEDELAHHTTHDALTGLPNGVLFAAMLDHACESLDGHASVAVIFVDVDRFQLVNDSVGHAVGDQLIVALAERFRSVLVAGDVLARPGGDEFIVLLEDTDELTAQIVAQRLVDALAVPVVVDGRELRVAVSVGVSVVSEPTSSVDMLRWADAAMYRAKDLGGDRVMTYDGGLSTAITERHRIDQDLRSALERDEFRVVYQPVVNLATGRIVGAEALVRWVAADGTLVAAGDFVPVAEENGMIVPIGRWVLQQAVAQAAAWIRDGVVVEDFKLDVNLSGRQLDVPGLADDVVALLDAAGLAPRNLCCEVTETALMRDVDAGTATLAELRDAGIRTAVDDFGTGYSSLHLLKNLPVDIVKIDRSFVSGLPGDTDDLAIATTILALASALGLGVTAEGVETTEQLECLMDLGCRFAQGYLFAKPLGVDEFAALASTQD